MTQSRASLALLLISLVFAPSPLAGPADGGQGRPGPYRTSAPWLHGSAIDWLRATPYRVDWHIPYLVSALSKPVGMCPTHDAKGQVVGYTTVSLLDLWHYLEFDYLNLGLDFEFELRTGSWYYDPASLSAEGLAARQAMSSIRRGKRKANGHAVLRIGVRDPLDRFLYRDLRLQLSLARDRAASWPKKDMTAVPTDARWYQLLSWDPVAQTGVTMVLKETIAYPNVRVTNQYGSKPIRRLGIGYTTSNHWFAPRHLPDLLGIGGSASMEKDGLPVRAQTFGYAKEAESILCTLAEMQASLSATGTDEVARLLDRTRHLLYAEPETFRYQR